MTEQLRRSPSGPLADVGGAAIVFRPGLASDGPNVATWAEVEDAIDAADGYITVFVDSSNAAANIPATADTDCRGRVVFAGANTGTLSNTLTVLDGGILRNPRGLDFLLTLTGAPTSQPFLVIDATNGALPEFIMGPGTTLKSTSASTAALAVASGVLVVFRTYSGIIGDGTNAAISIANGGEFEVLGFAFGGLADSSVSGPVGSTLDIVTDASNTTAPTLAAMLGTINRSRIDRAEFVNPSSGATGSRPTGNAVLTGQMYFDTTIGKPVWWTGATWVLATGVPG